VRYDERDERLKSYRLSPQWIAGSTQITSGSGSLSYTPAERTRAYAVATILSKNENALACTLLAAPATTTFRPELKKGLLNGALEITSKTAQARGQTCWVLERPRRSPDSIHSIWIDPSRDNSLVRCMAGHAKQGLSQLDVEHDYDSIHDMWIPSSWTHVSKGKNGEARFSLLAKRESYKVNEAFPASAFDFKLPVGTIVLENDGSGNRRRYVTLPNEGKRVITPEESAAKQHDRIVHEALTSSSSFVWWTVSIIVGGAVSLLLAWFFIWRWPKVNTVASARNVQRPHRGISKSS